MKHNVSVYIVQDCGRKEKNEFQTGSFITQLVCDKAKVLKLEQIKLPITSLLHFQTAVWTLGHTFFSSFVLQQFHENFRWISVKLSSQKKWLSKSPMEIHLKNLLEMGQKILTFFSSFIFYSTVILHLNFISPNVSFSWLLYILFGLTSSMLHTRHLYIIGQKIACLFSQLPTIKSVFCFILEKIKFASNKSLFNNNENKVHGHLINVEIPCVWRCAKPLPLNSNKMPAIWPEKTVAPKIFRFIVEKRIIQL